MFEKFWQEIGTSLVSVWKIQRLLPALGFWIGGIVIWTSKNGFDKLYHFLVSINTGQGCILGVICIIVLLSSSYLADWVALPVLRLFEGYWPKPIQFLQSAIIKRITNRLLETDIIYNDLQSEIEFKGKDWKIIRKIQRVEEKLSRYPENPDLLMATQLGNLMHASEEYPYRRYGLGAVIVWPKLWLVLPDKPQNELLSAWERIKSQLILLIWGILFSAWGMINWWIILLSIIGSFFIYRAIFQSAEIFGYLLKSVFDLHRFSLYRALEWPVPKTPAEEVQFGKELTTYLYRGFHPPALSFERRIK